MYLEKLEIQGFKSFAQKTIMEFPVRRKSTSPGIAAIVGPNGSGKSNAADAVRWVLGEQSIKLLRGKKSEDVIFSGSDKKARLGFAEVALHLNNEDKKTKIEYSQVVVKRRVYRDGSSEYYLNNSKVRLSDVQLLLAQANFGQRTYSVIGQGMVDAILSTTPQERKNFFDEATGVKQYQIKREQALHKIETTENNLSQANGLLKEISPRLKQLERQIKKLEKREELEKTLHNFQLEYYGNIWHKIDKNFNILSDQKKEISRQHLELTKKLTELQNKLEKLEKEQKNIDDGSFERAQSDYISTMNEKSKLISLLSGIEREIEILKKTNSGKTENINTEKLIQSVETYISFLKKISQAKTLPEFEKLQNQAKEIQKNIEQIINKKPEQTESTQSEERISGLTKKIDLIKKDIENIEAQVHTKEKALSSMRHTESKATTGVFDIQKKYQSLQKELNFISSKKNQIDVDLARTETRKDDIAEEINKEVITELRQKIKSHRPEANKLEHSNWDDIAKVKHELEMIGGIDPEIDSEHKETKKRYDFLSNQIEDLEQALEKTKKVLKELDVIIEKEFNRSFTKIEKGFTEYFNILFRGGKASLQINKESELNTISEEIAAELSEEERTELANTFKIGIDIKASPPGKKVSTISMLSGGERALTSIALICAIIHANPSPFVVLDEVDAALDEANSIRFSEILEKIAHETQFIAITHNRATMEKANILYGVTMGEDGVSKLLSVDLEKAVENIK
jgi:chromosome segregation ATPase